MLNRHDKLDVLDITISIFNQEEIIERVLFALILNTTTPFNLILVFDGCTDRTKQRALSYLKRVWAPRIKSIQVFDTPNLFELRANNYCFKIVKSDYFITLQDDMVVLEYGWERRLTYPLRTIDGILAVSGRRSHDIKEMGTGREIYKNIAANENGPDVMRDRNIFAIRDGYIRGPVAFRIDYLRELNYLNDNYAPGTLDDAELSLRAWRDKKWKVGSFWIDYISKPEWSKVNASDSTMKAWESTSRNQAKLYNDFKEYIDSDIKHTEDINIGENNVDYISKKRSLFGYYVYLFYPLRLDKRRNKTIVNKIKRGIATVVKYPFIALLSLFFGRGFVEKSQKSGFKTALKEITSKKK